jgi:hypothetical protein
MIKQLLLIVIAIAVALLGLSLGCATSVTPSHLPPTDNGPGETGTVEEDAFYFIFECGGYDPYDMKVLLDTKAGIIGKLGHNTYNTASYSIPNELLNEIYDLIVQYNIKSYSSPDLICIVPGRLDSFYWRITFRVDGEVYSVWFDSTVNVTSSPDPAINELIEKYRNLGLFYKSLTHLILSIDEYQSLHSD